MSSLLSALPVRPAPAHNVHSNRLAAPALDSAEKDIVVADTLTRVSSIRSTPPLPGLPGIDLPMRRPPAVQQNWFDRVTHGAGSWWSFGATVGGLVGWGAVAGPTTHFSDNWQIFIEDAGSIQ